MPDRRRQRYGDVDYDWDYRVETTSATVGWGTRFRGLLHAPYQPVDPELFRAIMSSLEFDFTEFTFLDIGSGKGRALLLASEHPFKRIIGVELLPELNQIASVNIQKFSSPLQRCHHIETVRGDATQFIFPPEAMVIFLFHPLPEAELRELMLRLSTSLASLPRPIYLIYAYPAFESVIAGFSSFQKIAGTLQYSVFRHI
ncbi:MAG: class I SAM-dependent methyltransferase [Acidobacteria bacterium]|nr:class I SAM-dependent methyltransferase [Acidobacteriota bacterium]